MRIAVYLKRCGVAPPCEIEELYEGTRITGPGQVLNKCMNHAEIPDDELWEFHRHEGMQIRQANLDAPKDTLVAYHFEGRGRGRQLRVQYLPLKEK